MGTFRKIPVAVALCPLRAGIDCSRGLVGDKKRRSGCVGSSQESERVLISDRVSESGGRRPAGLPSADVGPSAHVASGCGATGMWASGVPLRSKWSPGALDCLSSGAAVDLSRRSTGEISQSRPLWKYTEIYWNLCKYVDVLENISLIYFTAIFGFRKYSDPLTL